MKVTKTHAELGEAELARRLLMLRRPDRALPLLRGGLLSFLWAEPSPELGFARVGVRKIRAAQYMIRRFAGQAVGEASLGSDPGPVVRFLFLEDARPHQETRGLLFLDASGRGVGSRIFGRIPAPEPAAFARDALVVAEWHEAKHLVLFQIRPGDSLEAADDEAKLAESLRGPARCLGIEVAGHWVITGPAHWRSLGPSSFPAGPPGGRHFLGSQKMDLSEVRKRLDDLLHFGDWEAKDPGSQAPEVPAVRELVKDARAFRELAATPPDELCHPGLSPRGHRALAAALELTRRLGEVEVAPRPLAGGPEALAQESFPQVRHSPRAQVWLVALNAQRRTVYRELVPAAVLERDGAEFKRLGLRAALKPEVSWLVPLCFHPETPPLDLAEKLASEMGTDLSAVGVRCDDPLALSADGSWACRGRSGRLRT